MTYLKHSLLAAVAVTAIAGTAYAGPTTIDFSSYSLLTPVASVGDVTFTLYGNGQDGTPVIGSFGDSALGNSKYANYPTGVGIQIHFGSTASNVSFTFNNYGENDTSSMNAFAGLSQVDSQNIGGGCYVNGFCTVNVAGSDITDLFVENGDDTDWLYGIGSVTYTSGAVPEPASWAMMLGGFGLVGGAMRSRRKSAVTFA